MTSVDPNINDHLTRVQLRLLKQKLAEERDRTDRLSQARNPVVDDSNYTRLQEAIQRRKDLLERLKEEQQIRLDLQRPKTFNGTKNNDDMRHQMARRPASEPQHSEAKEIVEHHYHPARPAVRNTTHLPPLVQPYIPVVQAAPPAENRNSNTRSDMYEMMMMQNAQMHQMIMQQLMLSALPKPANHAADTGKVTVDLNDILDLKPNRGRQSPVVHHHVYSDPPPQPMVPPAVLQGYTQPLTRGGVPLPAQPYTLPPIQVHPANVPNYDRPRYYGSEPQWRHYSGQDHPSELHHRYHEQRHGGRQDEPDRVENTQA